MATNALKTNMLKEFFSDVSPYSITRVAFIWIVINATFMTWFVLIFGTKNAAEAGGIFVSLTSVAAGLKLYQKKQENEANKP